MAGEEKLRIGVSSCLLGETVRYDAGHKRHAGVIGLVGPAVEWVPVCPEMELGLGAPREPLNLTGDPDKPRLLAKKTEEDWTEPMADFARRKIDALKKLDLDAFIFKKSSPSCGPDGVKVHAGPDLKHWVRKGKGVFAGYLIKEWPDLPVTDEDGVDAPENAARFLDLARQYRSRRKLSPAK